MGIDKNSIVSYVISLIITLCGFVLIFLTRTTLTLAAGAMLVVIGLFLFLIVQEKKVKTSRQRSISP